MDVAHSAVASATVHKMHLGECQVECTVLVLSLVRLYVSYTGVVLGVHGAAYVQVEHDVRIGKIHVHRSSEYLRGVHRYVSKVF